MTLNWKQKFWKLSIFIFKGNAIRPSNIVNMNLQHVDEAVSAAELTINAKAMVMKSEIYKTSIIYGDKLIVIPSDVWVQLGNYVKHIRPLLIDDESALQHDRMLFTSMRVPEGENGEMTTSSVSKACSAVYSQSELGGP